VFTDAIMAKCGFCRQSCRVSGQERVSQQIEPGAAEHWRLSQP